MSKIKVTAFSVSLDGFGAGPDQSRANPLGKRGEELHEWIIPERCSGKWAETRAERTESICPGWDSPKCKPCAAMPQRM